VSKGLMGSSAGTSAVRERRVIEQIAYRVQVLDLRQVPQNRGARQRRVCRLARRAVVAVPSSVADGHCTARPGIHGYAGRPAPPDQ